MRKILFFIIVGVGVILTATSVPVNALPYNLDVLYSGTAPTGDQPWLTFDIADLATNTVQITMSTPGLIGTEFVSEWYFNMDFDINSVTLSFLAGTAPTPDPIYGNNSRDANGAPGHGFDYEFQWIRNGSPGSDRFEGGESLRVQFVGEGLNSSAFENLNAVGNFVAAAHVQAINDTIFPDDDSGWIAATESISAVPEPGTILLLGAGLAGLFGIRRFKFKKN